MAYELGFVFEIMKDFILLVFAVLALFYTVSIYNGLVVLRNNINRAWANIDVLLKQRSDLIPNLVETVKGYMKHEWETLTEITKLRSQLMAAKTPSDKAEASEAISSALRSIFALAENYPNLKASKHFLELQKQIASIENQIADRREFYNNSVMLYNTRIRIIPDSFIALLLGMRENEYFKVSESEKKPPKTSFP